MAKTAKNGVSKVRPEGFKRIYLQYSNVVFWKTYSKTIVINTRKGKNNLSLKTWLKIRTLSLSRKLLVPIKKKQRVFIYFLAFFFFLLNRQFQNI